MVEAAGRQKTPEPQAALSQPDRSADGICRHPASLLLSLHLSSLRATGVTGLGPGDNTAAPFFSLFRALCLALQ